MIPPHLGGPRPRPQLRPVGLDLDVSPKRAVSAWNIRRDTRPVVDALHAWWCVQYGRTLTQWEAFDVLLSYALANPELKVPPEIDELMRAVDR